MRATLISMSTIFSLRKHASGFTRERCEIASRSTVPIKSIRHPVWPVTGLTKLWFRQVGYPAVTDKKISSRCFGTKNRYHRVNTKYLCMYLNGPFRNDFMLSLSSTTILCQFRVGRACYALHACRNFHFGISQKWLSLFSAVMSSFFRPFFPNGSAHGSNAITCVTLRQFRRDRYAALLPNWPKWYTLLVVQL